MRRLLIKLGFLFIPAGITVVAVNYFVDPANIFSGPAYIKKIAGIMLAGNNVDNIDNYNERLLQQKLFTGQNGKADIVVLGSSRIMEIGSGMFPGKKLQNAGVSHANINDLLALCGLMDSLDRLPKEVIINVDPFLISKVEQGTKEWRSLNGFRTYFLNKYCRECIGGLEDTGSYRRTNKYYTIVTFDYFQQSISFLLKGKKKEVLNAGKEKPSHYGRYYDGSVAYPASYTNPDTVMIADLARKTGAVEIGEADEGKYRALQCLVKYLAGKQVKISLLMLPFHYNYFTIANREQDNIFNRYEKLFTRFAKENGLPLTGSFSPIPYNIANSEFYDAYHCSGNVIQKILEQQ